MLECQLICSGIFSCVCESRLCCFVCTQDAVWKGYGICFRCFMISFVRLLQSLPKINSSAFPRARTLDRHSVYSGITDVRTRVYNLSFVPFLKLKCTFCLRLIRRQTDLLSRNRAGLLYEAHASFSFDDKKS